ncbi:MAG: hypothetical protein Q9180_006009 [Flavoplaca navasiana]
MKRQSEKTFGPSPESQQSNKRQKLSSTATVPISPILPTEDDNVDDSDTLFIPTGKSKSKTRIGQKSSGPSERFKVLQKGQKGQSKAINKSLASSPISIALTDKRAITTKSSIPNKTPIKPSLSAKDPKASLATSRSSTIPKATGSILDRLGSFSGDIPLEDNLEVDSIQKSHNPEDLMSIQRDIPKTRSKPKSPSNRKPKSDLDKQADQIIAAFDLSNEQWPGKVSGNLQAVSHQKVPTELQYTGGGAFKWGFQIPYGVQRCKWFKLLLDPKSSRIEVGQALAVAHDTQAAPPGYDQEPEELVRDYLTALREHFEAVLAKELPSIAASTSIKYILTVPAVWSNEAIIKTRECAEQAGMGPALSLQIVTEPEAGAIWALYEIVPKTIKQGDTFVVCDAGGGTVDLITYRVKKLKPVLDVEEIVPGQGKQCGSTFLNRRFEAFLRQKLGSHPCWHEDVMEDTKKSYDGSKTDDENYVPVATFPDEAALGIFRRRMKLTGIELFSIFEPVIQDVIDLVEQQIQATKDFKAEVKAVLLIGGFGESEYLYQRLRDTVASQGIIVEKPSYGWTAIQRGALMKGLADYSSKNTKVAVTGRSARCHYGTESAKDWDERLHPNDQRYLICL